MNARDTIIKTGAIAIVRAQDQETARMQAEAIVAAGLLVIEVSLVTPGALHLIEQLAQLPEVTVGVGTALTVDHVRAARDAGAGFVVSPNTDPTVISYTKSAGLVSAPGVASATDVAAAIAAGADILKLFPASSYGPAHLRAMREPFPGQTWAPTGGIRMETIPDWWASGATVFGLGSPLVLGGLDQISANVSRFMDAIRSCQLENGEKK
jgi:2-dehydro-3-deoxyphosphogluconate aldolase/(4S)-4-hydroxy-2-oxoglutarate aldolase